MSLTATLLLGLPVQLPTGRQRYHFLQDNTGRCNATEAGNERNARIRAGNVAMVRQAITDGHGSYLRISEATGLSESTVKSICLELIGAGEVERSCRQLRMVVA